MRHPGERLLRMVGAEGEEADPSPQADRRRVVLDRRDPGVLHEFGPCFSMITTDANALMAPIHDRMPAILEEGDIAGYLAGEMSTFTPSCESLKVEDSLNPLVKPRGTSVQGELF